MSENLFIQIRSKLIVKVNSRDIHYIEVDNHYSVITTVSGIYRVCIPLSRLETILPASQFCRVSRSCIVPLFLISKIEDDVIMITKKEILLEKKYKEELFNRLKLIS